MDISVRLFGFPWQQAQVLLAFPVLVLFVAEPGVHQLGELWEVNVEQSDFNNRTCGIDDSVLLHYNGQ